MMFAADYSKSPGIVEALLKAKANVNACEVRHLEDSRCAHVYSLPTRVCSLQHGHTPLMLAARCGKSPGIVEALLKAKANLEATDGVRHLEDNRCATHVYSLTTRVCLLQDGYTPLMFAAKYAKSPGIVEALVKGKANLDATSKVMHLEHNRCSAYFCE